MNNGIKSTSDFIAWCYERSEKMTRYAFGAMYYEHDPAKALARMRDGIDRAIKDACRQRVAERAMEHKGPVWVSIQTVGDTCKYCTDRSGTWHAAGGGFADAFSGFHSKCDCHVAVSFDKGRNTVYEYRSDEAGRELGPFIDAHGTERESEYGVRYGKDAVASFGDEERAALKKKISGLGLSEPVAESLYTSALECVDRNLGTLKESMFLIDAETGEFVAFVHGARDKGIDYNDAMRKAVKKSQRGEIRLISIHNHPEGYPPSPEDFMKAFDNKYHRAFAIGHNGQLYEYGNRTLKMSQGMCDSIQNFIASYYDAGYDVDRAHAEALAAFGLSYKIVR